MINRGRLVRHISLLNWRQFKAWSALVETLKKMNQNEVLLSSLTNVVKAFEMVTKQTAHHVIYKYHVTASLL